MKRLILALAAASLLLSGCYKSPASDIPDPPTIAVLIQGSLIGGKAELRPNAIGGPLGESLRSGPPRGSEYYVVARDKKGRDIGWIPLEKQISTPNRNKTPHQSGTSLSFSALAAIPTIATELALFHNK